MNAPLDATNMSIVLVFMEGLDSNNARSIKGTFYDCGEADPAQVMRLKGDHRNSLMYIHEATDSQRLLCICDRVK